MTTYCIYFLFTTFARAYAAQLLYSLRKRNTDCPRPSWEGTCMLLIRIHHIKCRIRICIKSIWICYTRRNSGPALPLDGIKKERELFSILNTAYSCKHKLLENYNGKFIFFKMTEFTGLPNTPICIFTVRKVISSNFRCQNVPLSMTDMFGIDHKENVCQHVQWIIKE